MSSLTIPDLAGSRAKAAQLADQLPLTLDGIVVEVDVANVESASQSFVDELCKQVLVVRHAEKFVVHNASPRFAMHLNTAAQLRGVSERLSVDVRVGV